MYVFTAWEPTHAQNFMRNDYIEVGIGTNGSVGAPGAPAGYHPTSGGGKQIFPL